MAFVFNEQERERIQVLIGNARGMVLATTNEKHQPEAAFVNFVADPDFTIYFSTARSYRKTANLQKHKHVAGVFWEGEVSVQLEGSATKLGPGLSKKVLSRLERKYGAYDPYIMTGAVFFKITPHWIRLINRLGTRPQFTASSRGQSLP
jgi:general stress protein 26